MQRWRPVQGASHPLTAGIGSSPRDSAQDSSVKNELMFNNLKQWDKNTYCNSLLKPAEGATCFSR